MNSPDSTSWLERFRGYLQILARMNMQGQIQSKLDPSDVVQQTMLQAHQAAGDFRGTTDAQRAAWLRQILAHTIAHSVRDLQRDKRDIRREQSLEAAIERSSARLDAWLAADGSSPSRNASRIENAVRLGNALARLAEAQRTAVQRHYFDGQSLEEIANQLGRTTASVAGLIRRGLRRLRTEISSEESASD